MSGLWQRPDSWRAVAVDPGSPAAGYGSYAIMDGDAVVALVNRTDDPDHDLHTANLIKSSCMMLRLLEEWLAEPETDAWDMAVDIHQVFRSVYGGSLPDCLQNANSMRSAFKAAGILRGYDENSTSGLPGTSD